MVRLGRTGAADLLILQVEGVDDVGAAAGPPDALLVGVGREPELALPHDLLGHDTAFEQIDKGQLVPVVPARRRERQLAVFERQDIQRQVRECDLSAGGGEVPEVATRRSPV